MALEPGGSESLTYTQQVNSLHSLSLSPMENEYSPFAHHRFAFPDPEGIRPSLEEHLFLLTGPATIFYPTSLAAANGIAPRIVGSPPIAHTALTLTAIYSQEGMQMGNKVWRTFPGMGATSPDN